MANNNFEKDTKNEEIVADNNSLENNSTNFIQKNSKIIIIATVVVITIGAIYAFIRNKNQEDSIVASNLISRVLPYYEKADYKKALEGDPSRTYLGEPVKGFKYIASEFSGTEQGKIAAFYVGNILLSTAKYTEAMNYFEDASGSSSKEVQIGSMVGKAACLETEKKYEESAKIYEESAQMIIDDELKSRYSFYAAYAYEKAGKKDLAEKLYREITLSSKFSEFAQLAKEGLVRIGTIIE